MTLPKVSETHFTERLGVCAVERKLIEMRCIWRDTPNTDIGIDGQIEFVDSNGFSTGHLLAAQIKSGLSYFKDGDENTIFYYPSQAHRNYWVNFPIPVILILYNPNDDAAYWVDARRYLRSPATISEKAIKVPRTNILNASKREELIACFGSLGDQLLEAEEIIVEFAKNRFPSPSFNISYLELFGFGLTDICRKLFFSSNLFMTIAEERAFNNGIGVSLGYYEYDFLYKYIQFLINQNLIYYDFSDFLIDWEDRRLVPIFLCPLSPRGQEVVNKLRYSYNADIFHERYLSIDQSMLPFPLDEIDILFKKIKS
jgi:hypothetical protein